MYRAGKLDITYPGVANCDFVVAMAMSQLATNWQPAAVASPVYGMRTNNLHSI